MGSRTAYVTSTLFALAWLTLVACVATPASPSNSAAYPPHAPTHDPDIPIGKIVTVVVAEVHSFDDHVELAIFPSEEHSYEVVELYSSTLFAVAPQLTVAESERPADIIVPNTRLGVIGFNKPVTGQDSLRLAATEIMIMEFNAALLTPTPAPRWGEAGYPAPVAPNRLPTATLPPTRVPCTDCEMIHIVGVVTGRADDQESEAYGVLQTMSESDYGYWYVRVSPETTITYENWTPATLSDILNYTMIDVVGPLQEGGYILGDHVIILDPDTNAPPDDIPATPTMVE